MNEHFTYEPGLQQWQHYLDGTLSPGEKELFDEYLRTNEFAREALEGFQTDRGSLAYFMNEVPVAVPLPTPAANKLYLKFIAGGMILVSAVTVSLLLPAGKNGGGKKKPLQPFLPEETYAVLDSEYRAIEKLHPIEETRQLVCETKTVKQVSYTDITLDNQTSRLQPVEEKIINEPVPDKKETEITPVNPTPGRIVHKVNTLSFYDHKVIDYSNAYTAPIEKKKIVLTGIPADREDENRQAPEMNDELLNAFRTTSI